MNVLITGATGMVGKGVLLECLDRDQINKVTTVGRSLLETVHPKLSQIRHHDFREFESIKDQLEGIDAAYLCMGVSAAGLSEEAYTKFTYDYTMALAKILHAINPEMSIIYVSGQGTDSSEKGRTMWARVKGKTENDLLKLGFKRAFMFRPGAIIPLKGIKSKTKLYQFFYDYFLWLLKLMKWLMPNSIVNTTQIGIAMINASHQGYAKSVIDPADILLLAKS